MKNHPARCESCHQTIWLTEAEARAIEFPELWICDRCKGEPEVHTIGEFERSERE
jgi:NAD-dependent SIR2 family protein deacetylase